MCNGHSTRTSQGGSIAILKPNQHLQSQYTSQDPLRLLFSNHTSPDTTLNTIDQAPGTQVHLDGWCQHDILAKEKCWVVIHRDGDLASTTTYPLPPSNPFFTFPLDNATPTMHLPQKLDLGVGDAGIIGRRVCVMMGSHDEASGPMVIAEGIIGWN